jgi:precorrin-6B methylase 2
MHLILPYPRYGFKGPYGTVLVPRKPRIARVRLANGVVIDVYSEEVLQRLLKELKSVEPVKSVETIKPLQDNKAVDSNDFVANNPWLAIISKRGSE